jgi:spermidine/putrescine transport system ATP-binding protein
MAAGAGSIMTVKDDVAHTRLGSIAASATIPAIEFSRIRKRFRDVEAVRGCSLSVPRGEFVSLLGPSGCGKTTLLRIIGGFERQDEGSVRLHGELVDNLPPNKRPVNTVFQRYALFPHKTVFQNIAFPLEIMRVAKRERRERVERMLELVHLEGVEKRRAAQLSGGQSQRVALARALVGEPEVLLLDEPLAALDLKLRKAMQIELRRIQEEVGTTFIYVTHDQEEALTMSDSVVLMDNGRIVQQGPPSDIYERPSTVFASQFIGEANLFDGEVVAADGSTAILKAGPLDNVPVKAAGFTIGQKATISVRPERFRIRNRAIQSSDGGSAWHEGIVTRNIFMGHVIRLILETSPGQHLTVEEPAPAPDDWTVGARLEFTWDSDAVVVLAEQ